MSCNIGELKVIYKGFFEPKMHRAIADAIKEFGYEIKEADNDPNTNTIYLLFGKETG